MRDLSIVILVYNREDAIVRTLHELERARSQDAEIIVIDNASVDSSALAAQRAMPDAIHETLPANVGVAGFNKGVDRATREFVLVLDDDAWPEEGALDSALETMRTNASVGGVMFRKTHPSTLQDEWPYNRVESREHAWPDMGCGNLVRRDAWHAAGGYESEYFLYRNDTDLALSLLGAGYDVIYDPAWRVWHDSPVVRRQKPRWFRLATRNWIWMCRRHGRAGSGVQAALLGWLWAHKQAGASPRRHIQAVLGLLAGLIRGAPRLPESVNPDGKALRRLVKLKTSIRRTQNHGATAGSAPA